MTNIFKLMSTLLNEFEFELADEKESDSARMGGPSSDIPGLISVGISDRAGPLMARAQSDEELLLIKLETPGRYVSTISNRPLYIQHPSF